MTTLLGPADVRALAAALRLRPSKQRGQNFVIDPNTVRRVARVAGVGPADVVLEVGPGLGSLTLALLERARHVVAVEIDPLLASALPATVAAHASERAGALDVLTADAVRLTAADLPAPVTSAGGPSILVANLPYNVAVPVLLNVLEAMPTVSRGLVMVQAEVADRLVAPPGSRVYGVPSVKLAWYAQARRAGAIGRAVFWPAPNVDSALVALERRDPPDAGARRAEVFAVVDAAFAQRRKMLRSALSGWAGSAALAEAILKAAGVEPTLRGEALTVVDFARIAAARQVVAPVEARPGAGGG